MILEKIDIQQALAALRANTLSYIGKLVSATVIFKLMASRAATKSPWIWRWNIGGSQRC
jgi:flagellar biosynthesis protein FliQ